MDGANAAITEGRLSWENTENGPSFFLSVRNRTGRLPVGPDFVSLCPSNTTRKRLVPKGMRIA